MTRLAMKVMMASDLSATQTHMSSWCVIPSLAGGGGGGVQILGQYILTAYIYVDIMI